MRVAVLLSFVCLLAYGCTARSGQPAPSVAAPGVVSHVTASPSAEGTLKGTVVYRERMALPEACDVWVQLIEVDERGRTINVLSDTIDTASTPSIPLPFSLSYVQAFISPEGRYALQARIIYQGETLFATPGPVPVRLPLTEPVSLLTGRVIAENLQNDSSTDPDPASLTGHRWQLRNLYSVAAEIFDNQPAPHIVFHPDAAEATYGRLSGSDGCNLITATYELTEDGLDIRESAVTMRMCVAGMEQARALAVALEETDNWRLTGKKLEARQNDRTLAIFEAVAL